MESSEIARACAADDENARLRRIVANLTLENDAIEVAHRKKVLEPPNPEKKR